MGIDRHTCWLATDWLTGSGCQTSGEGDLHTPENIAHWLMRRHRERNPFFWRTRGNKIPSTSGMEEIRIKKKKMCKMFFRWWWSTLDAMGEMRGDLNRTRKMRWIAPLECTMELVYSGFPIHTRRFIQQFFSLLFWGLSRRDPVRFRVGKSLKFFPLVPVVVVVIVIVIN